MGGEKGSRTLQVGLMLLVAAGLAASMVSLAQAGSFRVAPSPFELAVPLKSVQGLSLERGLDPAVVLGELARAGVTAAVVEERTLTDLALLGGFAVVKGPDADRVTARFTGLATWRAAAPDVPVTLLLTRDPALADWAFERCRARFGEGRTALFRGAGTTGLTTTAVAVRGSLPSYTRIGLYPPDLDLVRGSGLRLVVQLQNPREQPRFPLAAALRPLAQEVSDVVAVSFDGGEVWGLGTPGGPSAAGRELAALALPFAIDADRLPAGAYEFGQAAGWRGVGVQEVWTTGRPELYAEGVVERQSPLLLIMPGFFQPFTGDPSWPTQMTQALAAFKNGIAARGLEPGRPEPVPAGRPAPVWPVLVGWGVLAGALLALHRVLSLLAGAGGTGRGRGEPAGAGSGRLVRVLWPAALAVAALTALALPFALASGARIPTLQGLALLAAMAFPVLALSPLLRTWLAGAGLSPAGAGQAWVWPAVREAGRMALVAAAGGLLIRALGTGPEFTLKVVLFRGIKLTLVAGPVVAVLFFWLLSTGGGRSRWDQLRSWVVGLLRAHLTLGTVATAVAVCVLAAYYVSRSGNTPLVAVSDLEFRVRRYLLDIFVVRPRTKEFLVSYPAVAAGTWLAVTAGPRRLRAAWGYVLAALAGIGPSSVLNTFSHFHIPAIVSLERTAYGLGLGVPAGLAVVALVRLLGRARFPAGKTRGLARTLAVLLLLAGLASLAVTWPGLAAGNPATRPVEVSVDLAGLEASVAHDPGAVASVCAGLASAGVSSVAVGETTVADLARAGAARIAAGPELQARALTGEATPVEAAVFGAPGFDPTQTYLFLPSADPGTAAGEPGLPGGAAMGPASGASAPGQATTLTADEVARRFIESTGDRSEVFVRLGSVLVVRSGYPSYVVETTGLGFPAGPVRDRLSPLRGKGLLIAPRPRNVPGGSPAALEARLDELKTVLDSLGLEWSTVVFEGSQVAGYPGHLAEAVSVLERRGLVPGLILSPGRPGYLGQSGTSELARVLGYRYARVLPFDTGTPPGTAAERAVARDVEVVYLRPSGATPDQTSAYLRNLSAALAARGRPGGRAAANVVTFQGPGPLTAAPWLGPGLVLGVLLLPLAGLALPGQERAPGGPDRGTGGPDGDLVTRLLAVLLVSLAGGLVARALFSDARILLELRPATVSAALPLLAALLAVLVLEPWGVARGSIYPAWWGVTLTPILAGTLIVVVAAGWWLAGGGFGGWLPAAPGRGLAAVLLGSAAAGLALGSGPGGRLTGAAAVGLAYAGSALALYLAGSAGKALLWALVWPLTAWIGGMAVGLGLGSLAGRLPRKQSRPDPTPGRP